MTAAKTGREQKLADLLDKAKRSVWRKFVGKDPKPEGITAVDLQSGSPIHPELQQRLDALDALLDGVPYGDQVSYARAAWANAQMQLAAYELAHAWHAKESRLQGGVKSGKARGAKAARWESLAKPLIERKLGDERIIANSDIARTVMERLKNEEIEPPSERTMRRFVSEIRSDQKKLAMK